MFSDRGDEMETGSRNDCFIFFLQRSQLSYLPSITLLVRAFLLNAIQRAHKYFLERNMVSVQRSFYLINVRAISALFFFTNGHNVLMVLLFYNKGTLEKVARQRTQPTFFFVAKRTENRTQLNAAHA